MALILGSLIHPLDAFQPDVVETHTRRAVKGDHVSMTSAHEGEGRPVNNSTPTEILGFDLKPTAKRGKSFKAPLITSFIAF